MHSHRDLTDILRSSSFGIVPGTYVYARASEAPPAGHCFLVATDSDEITVVAEVESLRYLNIVERNDDDYALIAVSVAVPFYSVGFLAAVCTALAKCGLDVLVVSTFSKDYVLVRDSSVALAARALLELGLKEAPGFQPQ
jgi:hypothetical protein